MRVISVVTRGCISGVEFLDDAMVLPLHNVKVRVFPSDDALLRLVSAVLVEIDEKWASETKAYIKWECQDA